MKFLIILAMIAVTLADQAADELRTSRCGGYRNGRNMGGVYSGAGYGRRRRDASMIAPTRVANIEASLPVDQEPVEDRYTKYYTYYDSNQAYGSNANRWGRNVDLNAVDSSLSGDLESAGHYGRRWGGYTGYGGHGGYGGYGGYGQGHRGW